MIAPRTIAVLILIFLGISGPVNPGLTGEHQQAPVPTFSAWLISPAPEPLCPGDRAAISIMSLETTRMVPVNGYPMNIIQSYPAIGRLDPVSKVVVNGIANFVYIAADNLPSGTTIDMLTFFIGGFPTGLALPITVYGSCDYRLTLLLEQHTQEEGYFLNTIINGELVLKRAGTGITSQAHGEGTDDVYLDLGGDTQAFSCRLEPAIQGSSTFQADATFNPVAPGMERMSFDLIFDGVNLNSAVLRCDDVIPGMNVNAEVPFNPGTWDPNELNLQGLSVVLNHGSGTTPIAYKSLRGQVIIEREVNP